MTSLQTCTANTNPHVKNEEYDLYLEKKQMIIYQQSI